MPFAVQLDLDAHAAVCVGRIFGELEAVSALQTIRRLGNGPHLSLAVYDELPIEQFIGELCAFAKAMIPMEVTLRDVKTYPGGIIFLSVEGGDALAGLHRNYHEALHRYAGSCSGYFLPGEWDPHVTLAMNVGQDALDNAVALACEHWRPAAARLESLRVIRFFPVETLWQTRL
jgi:hypothetical protein